VRDPRQAELIRQAFIPRSDEYELIEFDYSALEFRGAANFWQDPAMVEYASDPKLDIHRDMAAECYGLSLDQVSKPCRSFAKNQFVFPVIYGSTHKACSRNLWIQIGRGDLKRVDGVPIYEHLRQLGITEMAAYAPDGSKLPHSYENMIQKVENRFHQRFPHWSSERDIWWEKYLERGWFKLSTGFVAQGVFSYNNLMNTPIQGPSFHILLWALTRINAYLKQHKMKSRVICQIHDSILGDVHQSERDDYIALCQRVMTLDVRKRFPWIVTTMGVEAEGSAVSWFHKKKIDL
jgi:DNA polymerase-1